MFKKKTPKPIKVYRKSFSLNKDMPRDRVPQLSAHRENCQCVTVLFPFFLWHLLLATITDNLLNCVDLWPHPSNLYPLYSLQNTSTGTIPCYQSTFCLCNRSLLSALQCIYVMHIIMLHMELKVFFFKSQMKVRNNFKWLENPDRFSNIFH